MPVNAPPADKRFRRSHVRPTSRRDSWRGRVRRGLAAAGLVVLFASVVYGAVGYAVTSSSLTIRHIAVSGNQRLSSGQVQALLGHLIGSSTVAADIEQARRKLTDFRWVDTVEIRRVFPASVSVVLTEKQAIALGRINGSLFLIDRSAMFIDELRSQLCRVRPPDRQRAGQRAKPRDAPRRAARDDARAVSRLPAVAP